MRKILPISLLTIWSTGCFAMTPIINLTEGWRGKGIPIVVNDTRDYFYADQVCPPEIIISPPPCGRDRTQEIYNKNTPTQPGL